MTAGGNFSRAAQQRRGDREEQSGVEIFFRSGRSKQTQLQVSRCVWVCVRVSVSPIVCVRVSCYGVIPPPPLLLGTLLEELHERERERDKE